MAKFIIKSAKPRVFSFTLVAPGGEIMLASETYTTKDSCLKGIESVKTNAPDPAKYGIFEKGKSCYFTLKAANNKVVGTSGKYSSLKELNSGIASIQKNAPLARVEDTTVK